MHQDTTALNQFSGQPAPVLRRFRLIALLVVAVGLFVASRSLGPELMANGMLAASVTLLVLCLVDLTAQTLRAYRSRNLIDSLRLLTEHDSAPAILCSAEGQVIWMNAAADRIAEPRGDLASLPDILRDHIASPQVVLRRLQTAAHQTGVAGETVVGLDASVRLQVQKVGSHAFWRVDLRKSQKEDSDTGTPALLLGRNGVILSMNQSARDLIGTRAKSAQDLFRDPDISDGQTVALMTTQGERQVHVSLRPTDAGRTRVFMVPTATSNIALLGTRLADLPLPAMCISAEGRILEANALVSQLLQNAPCEGHMLDDILEGLSGSVAEVVKQIVLGSQIAGPEIYRLKGEGSEAFVQMTLKRIVRDETVILIAILNDATELKTLEAQFVQGQKMQAIGQLAGGVAHDFNNLLTAISGHCDLMLLRHDQGDQDYADLIQIHQNANRAAALVSQLLAFSRKQTLQPEYLDLRDTLSDLAHLLNRLVGERVSLMLSHDPVLQPIRADKRQLEQVIMNLVVNARDAMPDGGKITIETESLTLTQALKRDRATVSPGEYVVVRVQDDGVGIPSDVLGKIFEPFVTTKRAGEGTGLGLSTAYGIVKQTGGYIFVDSQLGKGTCFSLMFAAHPPLKHEVKTLPSRKEALTAEPCEGVVLLVEDEAPVRAFASRALSLRGFDVLEAACAEDALDMLSDPTLNVDVFVTDVVMPGMDGPTWVRKALVDRPDVRVVFVSGYAEGAFEGDDPGVPGAIFLPKPFSLGDLTATVQDQMT